MDDLATRRTVLGTMLRTTTGLGAALAFPAAGIGKGRVVTVIAGTYAREGGKGLYPLTFDGDRWQAGTPIAGIDDASFGIGGGPGGVWYGVRERVEGQVSAYAPDWGSRGTVPSGGADPCHLALDRQSACLAVANYSSGSVAFHRLDRRTGALGDPVVFRHAGTGPDRKRQDAPHAHWVGFSPDRRWLHAIDLGADAIFAYRFDAEAREVAAPAVSWRAPAGAGPRHMVRHPRRPLAYVVCELANTVMTLDARADGSFATRSATSTLPAGYAGASQAAHIAIDRQGRRLYVSNRGHDSIAVFALDADGMPTLLQHIASGGSWPRMFLVLEAERRLIVGNERSGTIAIFRLDPDGRLVATGQSMAVPGVVFLGRLG